MFDGASACSVPSISDFSASPWGEPEKAGCDVSANAIYLRITYWLPVYLLVIGSDQTTAQWARNPIPNEAPCWPTVTVKPLVFVR